MSAKDLPRFDSVPEMPSPKYDYRSSDCRAHANRYAARKLRNPSHELDVEERAWQCVGCLLGAPPSHLSASGDAPAAATQIEQPATEPAPAKSAIRARAGAGAPRFVACVVGRRGLTEGRLYLAYEEHEDATGHRVITKDDNGIKANCNATRFVDVLRDGSLPQGWFTFEDERGRVHWVHRRHARVRLICGEESRRAGGGLIGRFAIEGSTLVAATLLAAIDASEALSARPVIAEPLRLAIIAEEESAAAPHEPAPFIDSERAPAGTNVVERGAAE